MMSFHTGKVLPSGMCTRSSICPAQSPSFRSIVLVYLFTSDALNDDFVHVLAGRFISRTCIPSIRPVGK